MALPKELPKALACIVHETANMSYPAAMSRGKKPVVAKDTKKLVLQHFLDHFPVSDVWQKGSTVAANFETWHRSIVMNLATSINEQIRSGNNTESVAAKFLNTFLHQLTKYDEARFLVPLLHLPLDSRVFSKLRRIESLALAAVQKDLKGSPYSLHYDRHLGIQRALSLLLRELNNRPEATFRFKYRIELNWLWL